MRTVLVFVTLLVISLALGSSVMMISTISGTDGVAQSTSLTMSSVTPQSAQLQGYVTLDIRPAEESVLVDEDS